MKTPSHGPPKHASDWLALQAGESAAVETLIGEHEEALLRFTYALLRNASQAEDVVQEAFIRYVRHAREGREAVQNPRAWLYRVAHNLALDQWRRGRRTEALDEVAAANVVDDRTRNPAEQMDQQDTARHAMMLLEQLGDRERQIILLKVMEHRSYQEIAEIMDLTPTNVGFILHTSLKKLAVALRARLV